MSYIILRLDLTLNNLLDELEERIEKVVLEEHSVLLSASSKLKICQAIHRVLAQDMVQSDLCGFSIYCSENLAEPKPPEFYKKSDEG